TNYISHILTISLHDALPISIVSCLSFLSPYGLSPLTVFSSFFTLFITTNPTNNTTITRTIIRNLFLIYYKASSFLLVYILFYMNLKLIKFNDYIIYNSLQIKVKKLVTLKME